MTVLQTTAVETITGLPVERASTVQRTLNKDAKFFIRLALQNGTLLSCYTQATKKHLDRDIKKHGLPLTIHILHIVEKTRRAAPRRNNDILKLACLVQHITFQLAKAILTSLMEEIGNRTMETFLDIPVEIDKGQSQFAGKGLSKGCLSGTHVTGQKDAYHIYYSNSLWFVDKDKQFCNAQSQKQKIFVPLPHEQETKILRGMGRRHARHL